MDNETGTMASTNQRFQRRTAISGSNGKRTNGLRNCQLRANLLPWAKYLSRTERRLVQREAPQWEPTETLASKWSCNGPQSPTISVLCVHDTINIEPKQVTISPLFIWGDCVDVSRLIRSKIGRIGNMGKAYSSHRTNPSQRIITEGCANHFECANRWTLPECRTNWTTTSTRLCY